MTDLNLAIIGNCSFGALIDRNARVTWACLPRFDSDPTFCSLLGNSGDDPDTGFFDIVVQRHVRSEQRYLHNTAVLITTLFDDQGGAVEITDFAPRYRRLERSFRPTLMVRMIRPVEGHPCITIRLRPAYNYGAAKPEFTRGSNHIRYVMPDLALRCTTSGSVSYLQDEIPFMLDEPITMLIGADEPLASPILDAGRDFLEHTIDYWQNWSRFLSVPFEWQKAVIRAAITLKLCNFEETGAIIAAMTTSIPEAPDSGRNWDYRYCWLRDGYFVVQALNRLGATKTMEGYIQYVTNIVARTDGGRLQPVYGVALNQRLVEHEVDTLPGYRGMGPVRYGNQAYEHIQNDVYGSVILAATQTFFDERLTRQGDVSLFERLEAVGERCVELYDKPDAGLWELRTKARVHTYSSVMCWA
ncbi:MAG: glycoside hydrolase family 15 protein, partial [Rhodospirillales bacterium]|nr:glycoside hydrolase family 15 protein [Rhodospirillales bacterium]